MAYIPSRLTRRPISMYRANRTWHQNEYCAPMLIASYQRKSRTSTISWMLILVFLLSTLFSYHYHLHHVPDSIAQAVDNPQHVIDFHAHLDGSGFSHHDESHSIEPVQDAPIKKSGVELPWFAILLTLLLILPLRTLQGRLRPGSFEPRPYRNRSCLTPQLRAPPRT